MGQRRPDGNTIGRRALQREGETPHEALEEVKDDEANAGVSEASKESNDKDLLRRTA